MPMLKVRGPEKRFSRYTTITFKRPRPRNNFKHSQKILGPLHPLSASSQPRFQGSIRLNFFFTLLRLGSRSRLTPRPKSSLSPIRTFRLQLKTICPSQKLFARTQLFIEDRISAIPIPIPTHRARSPIPNHLANSDPIPSNRSRSTSHSYCHIVENDNHLLAREALD